MKVTFDKVLQMFGSLQMLSAPAGKSYQFTGGACYQIAKDVNILRRAIVDYTDAKDRLPKDSPEVFEKEHKALLAQEVTLEGILPIKASTLNLDLNPITPRAIADLAYLDLVIE